jgi:serine phosphatase RsbU (regulator of sigma subunit)
MMPNHGFPLGVDPDFPKVAEHEFIYESGDLLVLYTDGLVEYNHDVEAGEESLLRIARETVEKNVDGPARFIFEQMLQSPAKHPDDVAVMTIYFE